MEERLKALTGDDLRQMFSGATSILEENAEAVNALNVFPVPDGDTGTNMLLTMRAVLEEMGRCSDNSASSIAEAMARGALLGARGNSGVILSQFFNGMAKAFQNQSTAKPQHLAQAFQEGATASYKAVSKPVEGTMLTVIREAAVAAQIEVTKPSADVISVMESAAQACRASVANTPNLLSVLKEAGVVDAGGQGFLLILEGALCRLKGEPLEGVYTELAQAVQAGRVSEEFLVAVEEEFYGYCTQFLIQGKGLDPGSVRERLTTMAESAVVVGDDTMIKVHVHALDPGSVVSYAVSLGTMSQVKIQSMDEQHREFTEARLKEMKGASLGVVAVGWGEGIEKLLHNLGSMAVVRGGQTMNPSAQELLKAMEETGARKVILLPNNANIIPVAQQAASLSARELRVVPTRTIPEGVAALLAYNPDEEMDENVEAMERARRSVRTGEICEAIRDASLDGVDVRRGQVMGLLDGKLLVAGDDCWEVLKTLVAAANPADGSLVTLYWGERVTRKVAERDAERLRQSLPGLEVEVVYGGQPYYLYLISME